jgi:hypothetical protein
MKVEVVRGQLTELNLSNLLEHDPVTVSLHHDCIRRSSVCWLGLADGMEAAAAGLIPKTIFDDEPYLWMITTKLALQHPLRFTRWSRKVVDEILDLYPSVIGLCHCDNVSGRRWLEWLGARFDDVHHANSHVGFRIMRWQQQ